MPLLNDADNVFRGSTPVDRVYHEDTIVWQATPDPGVKPTVGDVSQAGTLSVSWGASADAAIYWVYRNGFKIGETSARSYFDSGLAWNASYTYTVVPVNDSGVPGDESPPSDSVTIPQGTNTALNASNKTYTNVTVSWGAVLGATHYEVFVNSVSQGLQTALSKNVTTTADTTKTIYVQPIRNSVYGSHSGLYTYYSGRPSQRDVGSKTDMDFPPYRIDSWRSVDAWGYLSHKAAQGTFGTYGSYKGVIYFESYGVPGLRDYLRTQLGSASRQTGGWCTAAWVYLHKRAGVGSSGPVTARLNVTNNNASGPEPHGSILDWVTATTASGGAGSWISIGTTFGQHLGTNGHVSLITQNDGTANYAHFETCTVRLNWAWDYETVSAQANVWGTP